MDMQSTLHEQDGLMVVQSMQDVEPVLNYCRDKADSGNVGSSEMRHAASIPMVVIESYCNRIGITFQEWLQNKEHVKRMLNDPDLAGFRIWQGAV